MASGGGAAGEPKMATYTDKGLGRVGTPGSIKWLGSIFFRTSSSGSGGKLAFLNNLVGLFESEIDADGNFFEKAWEWKYIIEKL
jgi:hypothetical protein